MKTLSLLVALVGMLAVAGCASPRGGTADDYDSSYSAPQSSSADMNEHWATSPVRDTSQTIPPP